MNKDMMNIAAARARAAERREADRAVEEAQALQNRLKKSSSIVTTSR